MGIGQHLALCCQGPCRSELDTRQGRAPHAFSLLPRHNRVANRIKCAFHSLYCLKHKRPVLDTTVDDASAMGATMSNHTIQTIPQGDITIFVVDYGSWKAPYAPGKGLVARAGLCWAPTGAWPSRSEACAPDVMIEGNAQFRRPLWLETNVSGV